MNTDLKPDVREAAQKVVDCYGVGYGTNYQAFVEAVGPFIMELREALSASSPSPPVEIEQRARELLADILEFTVPTNAAWLRTGEANALTVYRNELDILTRALASPQDVGERAALRQCQSLAADGFAFTGDDGGWAAETFVTIHRTAASALSAGHGGDDSNLASAPAQRQTALDLVSALSRPSTQVREALKRVLEHPDIVALPDDLLDFASAALSTPIDPPEANTISGEVKVADQFQDWWESSDRKTAFDNKNMSQRAFRAAYEAGLEAAAKWHDERACTAGPHTGNEARHAWYAEQIRNLIQSSQGGAGK